MSEPFLVILARAGVFPAAFDHASKVGQLLMRRGGMLPGDQQTDRLPD